MFDWLRFFPIALRYGSSAKRVSGPYFSKLRKKNFNIDDNILSISLPRTNSLYGFEPYSWKANRFTKASFDALNPERWDSKAYGNTARGWSHNTFYLREWLFSGEWFTNRVSSVDFSMSAVAQFDFDDFNGANFFHPNVFESVISNYLNSCFGNKKSDRKVMYCGPLNWRLLNISTSVQGVCFDVHNIGNSSRDNPELLRIVLIPLSENRFLNISFNMIGVKIYSDAPSVKPMIDLCESIISSISVKLSDKALENWNQVKEICPDMSLTKEFGELKWPIKPEDIGKATALAESPIEPTTGLLGKS